jgi:hypothetical protein
MMGMCGGVFRTQDDGLSWTEIGLSDQQISGVTMTEQGNLFVSSWQSLTPNTSTPGIFILYSGTNTFAQCFNYAFITDVAVNSSGYIFASFNTYHGTFPIYLSTDNGSTFAPCSDEVDGIFRLYCDKSDYIYALPEYSENFIYRTASPTTGNNKKVINTHKINVYPNPSYDKITVEVPQELRCKKCTVAIKDINGKTLFRDKKFFENNLTLDVSAYTSGIYIIEFSTQNVTFREKIVKY